MNAILSGLQAIRAELNACTARLEASESCRTFFRDLNATLPLQVAALLGPAVRVAMSPKYRALAPKVQTVVDWAPLGVGSPWFHEDDIRSALDFWQWAAVNSDNDDEVQYHALNAEGNILWLLAQMEESEGDYERELAGMSRQCARFFNEGEVRE